MSLRCVHVRDATKRRSMSALVLLGVLGIAGCGGSSPEKPASTKVSTPTTVINAEPTATPTATPTAAIFGAIVWTTAINAATSAPVDKVASFGQDASAIYAVVPVKGVAPGLTVTADWTFNGSPLPGVSSTVVATRPVADGWLEFHLTLAAGQTWPAGTYHIDIHQPLGGAVHADVNVKLPTS